MKQLILHEWVNLDRRIAYAEHVLTSGVRESIDGITVPLTRSTRRGYEAELARLKAQKERQA